VVDDILLCLSELVTNAIQAECERLIVELSVDDTRVRLAVTDDGSGWPVLQRPAPAEPSGRGLMIVDALACTWGVEPAGSSKRVWAEVPSAAG
jgi:two-component sensor histidine kinase